MSKQADIDGKSRKNNIKVTSYMLVTFIFFALLLGVPCWYTSKPESCSRCHSMEKYFISWKKSSHAISAGSCFDCHIKQGPVNIWIYRMSFYREIYSNFAGLELKPPGISIPDVNSCSRKGCHSLNRIGSTKGDININHREHVKKADLACVKCHPDAVHPDVGKTDKPDSMAVICKECHAARINDCSLCHNKGVDSAKSFKH